MEPLSALRLCHCNTHWSVYIMTSGLTGTHLNPTLPGAPAEYKLYRSRVEHGSYIQVKELFKKMIICHT